MGNLDRRVGNLRAFLVSSRTDDRGQTEYDVIFDSIFEQLGESLASGGGPEDPVMRLTGLWDLVFTDIRFKFQGHNCS